MTVAGPEIIQASGKEQKKKEGVVGVLEVHYY